MPKSETNKNDRRLSVFISYAKEDKVAARKLYERLKEDGFNPWLDEQCLLPGQDWELEIDKALRKSDSILLCFSKKSVSKEGFVQREYKQAKKYQEEKPEGAIFAIPIRFDNCNIPTSYQGLQWVDFPIGYSKLVESLNVRKNEVTSSSWFDSSPEPNNWISTNKPDVGRVQNDLENPDKISASELQRRMEENAPKLARRIEWLSFLLIGLVLVSILIFVGGILEIGLSPGGMFNKFIIPITILILISYTHYNLVLTISEFERLSRIHRAIIKLRNKSLYEMEFSSYLLIIPTLFNTGYSSSSGIRYMQLLIWSASLWGITFILPFGSEIIGLLNISIPADSKYFVLSIVAIILMIVFNLQSGLTVLSLLGGLRSK